MVRLRHAGHPALMVMKEARERAKTARTHGQMLGRVFFHLSIVQVQTRKLLKDKRLGWTDAYLSICPCRPDGQMVKTPIGVDLSMCPSSVNR